MARHFSEKKYNIRLLLCLTLLLFCSVSSLSASEQNDYVKIVESAWSDNYDRLSWLCRNFYKNYPSSKLIPDVMIIESRTFRDTDATIQTLKKIIQSYPGFSDRDHCMLKICEILYLNSRWSELDHEAQRGIKMFGNKNRFYPYFLHYRSKASFYRQNYAASIGFADETFNSDRSFVFYPELRLQNIFSEQKLHYDSDRYVTHLKESYFELEGTGAEVSSLYLLGRNCELKNRHSLAFSIYNDLIKKYPRSPEALMSKKRTAIIAEYKPKYIKNPLAALEKEKSPLLDYLTPDSKVPETNFKSYYALSIGPFYNLQEAEKLTKQLSRDFPAVSIVRGFNFFMIYVGRSETSESAMHYKIRLAEEFRINGEVVYIATEKDIRFIHKE
ncbi:MAG: tetratricopeptide repeat protein [Spirochaetes bacterium]|jgi:hypothetical protein|nr:tetratricopeptide repeat protein [Spirochaetota bacterium]